MKYIEICGARTHNLKNVHIKIPKNQFVVVTGLSGSGKSSLVLDTLFNYSKKLYLEALSSRNLGNYNTDFEVDYIQGTQPPVALEQTKTRFSNPRSTVSTISGIEGYLRVLFATLGHPVCPVCFNPTDKELFCDKCVCFAEQLIPQNFSANHKEGMCINCSGIGKLYHFTEDKIIPDKSKSLKWIYDNAASKTFSSPSNFKVFKLLCEAQGISVDVPYKDLPEEFKKQVLYGSEQSFVMKLNKVINEVRHRGIITYLDSQYKTTKSEERRKAFEVYLDEIQCPECSGGKIRKEAMGVKIGGLNYSDIQKMPIVDLVQYLEDLELTSEQNQILREALSEIKIRSENICKMSVGYLSLNRKVNTLSGGELQRVLISQHIASDLTGVLYILDEPSIGLHNCDIAGLIEMLKKLRDMGNSVIVIEHDDQVIQKADWIIEIGPGAGKFGGEVLTSGPIKEVMENPKSITSTYFKDREKLRDCIDIPNNRQINIKNAVKNNLKNITVSFPLNCVVCITGVSGAGKSSLLETLYDEMLFLRSQNKKQMNSQTLEGYEAIDDIIYVKQKPIGISSRSNIATYIGIYDHIRDFFSKLPDAKTSQFDKSHFSINVPGGRCEKCSGLGYIEIDMHFLKNEYALCDDCKGRQFNDQVLAVKFKDKNIHDVLNMSIGDALEYFNQADHPKIYAALELLELFGLDYLKLGQTTPTLSGGESQRINLITELLKKKRNNTLFIFDEPTTGLHFADIKNLSKLFNELIGSGNSLVIIEHNLDVIYHADYVVDLGPHGGQKGGTVVFSGTPVQLMECSHSYTGFHLKKHFEKYYKAEYQVVAKT